MALGSRTRSWLIRAAVVLPAASAFALHTPRHESRATTWAKVIAADVDPMVELGHRLFFDPLASRAGVHACADCHQPDHGFSDPAVLSTDDLGPTAHHSQTLVNASLSRSAHWDGEFSNTARLALARIDPAEAAKSMYYGEPKKDPTPDPSLDPAVVAQVERLAKIRDRRHIDLGSLGERYHDAFEAAHAEPQLRTVVEAIAAYCRTIQSGVASFDRWREGDEHAISPAAVRGYNQFLDTGCANCHRAEGPRPAFSDDKFHVTGIAWRAAPTPREGDRVVKADVGRYAISHDDADRRAFKTPSLRDVARRGPFMHDGSCATLRDVVRYYFTERAQRDPQLDASMPMPRPSARDVDDVVAFLETLSSDEAPGTSAVVWSRRAERTELRLLDVDGNALAGRAVSVYPSGDAIPVGHRGVQELVADADGVVRYETPNSTHARIEVDGGLPIFGGDRVPDTARSLTLVLEIRGTVKVTAKFAGGAEPPSRLTATQSTGLLAGERPTHTSLRLGATTPLPDGTIAATYTGDRWSRTGASSTLEADLGGERRFVDVPSLEDEALAVDFTR